jgi:hypothetical protein
MVMIEEEERRLYEEGERLAKLAVKHDVASTELRSIFKVCQTKPLAYLRAYIEMQSARKLGEFGRVLLQSLSEHDDRRDEIESVLRYMNMTYNYVKMMQGGGEGMGELIPPEVILKVRSVLKKKIEGLGIKEVNGRKQAGIVHLDVHLKTFPHGNPGILAKELSSQIQNEVRELQGYKLRLRFVTDESVKAERR